MKFFILTTLVLSLVLSSCRKRTPEELKARSDGKHKLNLPLEKEGKFMCVIETPAGSSTMINYNKINHQFEASSIDGKFIKTKHLSIPFNYGFLPSTFKDPSRGGNGGAVEVIVLSGRIPSEAYSPIVPIGLFHYKDKGIKKTIVIAKSIDPDYQTISVEDLSLLPKGALEIISSWLCNNEGNDRYKLDSWGVQREALNYINQWKLSR